MCKSLFRIGCSRVSPAPQLEGPSTPAACVVYVIPIVTHEELLLQQSAEAAAAAVRVEYSRKDAEVRPYLLTIQSAGPIMPCSACCEVAAGLDYTAWQYERDSQCWALQGNELPGPILTIGDAFAADSLHEEPGVHLIISSAAHTHDVLPHLLAGTVLSTNCSCQHQSMHHLLETPLSVHSSGDNTVHVLPKY